MYIVYNMLVEYDQNTIQFNCGKNSGTNENLKKILNKKVMTVMFEAFRLDIGNINFSIKSIKIKIFQIVSGSV